MNPQIHPDARELAGILEPHWSTIVERSELSRPGVLVALQTTDAQMKDRLKAIDSELGAAREAEAEANKKVEKAHAIGGDPKSGWMKDGTLDASHPTFQAAKAAQAERGEAKEKVLALQAEQGEILRYFAGNPGAVPGPIGAPPFAGRGWNTNALLQTNAEALMLAATSSSFPVGRVDLGRAVDAQALAASLGTMSREALAADVAGTEAMRRGPFYGVVPQLRRRLRVLDLIPTDTMEGQKMPYTRESGSFATAAETAEGTTKPEAAITYTDEEASAQTIAHWLKVQKQSLADHAQMQTTIDSRLRYGVLLRLEDQVLAGDGTGDNLDGIVHTSGIGSVAFDADELPADQILTGIVTVFVNNGEASAIVMNPFDWARALRAKADGDGHYYSNGPFSVTPETMWGVPLIPSNAIAQGRALVGDFALGAQLFIREGVNVLISDSDQDDFTKNKVTLLGELRAALAVLQPGVFADVELAA